MCDTHVHLFKQNVLFFFIGGQARDVQLCPWYDLRPHRVAVTDPVRHAPAGWADRAQTEGHLQNRLRQQVRVQPPDYLRLVLSPLQIIFSDPRISPQKSLLAEEVSGASQLENNRSSLSARTNWRDLALANCAVLHHKMTALTVAAGRENDWKIVRLHSAVVMKL